MLCSLSLAFYLCTPILNCSSLPLQRLILVFFGGELCIEEEQSWSLSAELGIDTDGTGIIQTIIKKPRRSHLDVHWLKLIWSWNYNTLVGYTWVLSVTLTKVATRWDVNSYWYFRKPPHAWDIKPLMLHTGHVRCWSSACCCYDKGL